MPFRVGLGLSFFVAVNLFAGLLAELFRYPSLWGNSTGIFGEYAYPVPYGWALAHWVTMLPLTLLAMGMPTWDSKLLVRARWISLIVLMICVGIELSENINRFQKIPFLLFFMVDAALFLFLALLFRPPVRVMVVTLTAMFVMTTAWVYLPVLYRSISELELPDLFGELEAQVQSKVTVQPLIADTELILQWQSKKAIYYFKLSAIVDPDMPPFRDEICVNAQSVYRQLLDNDPAPAGFGKPTVQFMARAWFDASDTYLFPSGKAHIANDGSWVCRFEYPEPDTFNNQG